MRCVEAAAVAVTASGRGRPSRRNTALEARSQGAFTGVWLWLQLPPCLALAWDGLLLAAILLLPLAAQAVTLPEERA